MDEKTLDTAQKDQLRMKITSIIASLDKPGSWCHLSTVAQLLKEQGISYKEFKYPKLVDFLNEFSESFEIYYEPNPIEGAVPIPKIKIKASSSSTTEKTNDSTSSNTDTKATKSFKTPDLFDWAFISDQQIVFLAEKIAVYERWYFGEKEPDSIREKYKILTQYLRHTFGKLRDDKKILFSKDENTGKSLAAFNTGLVDKKYEYIYALFAQNPIQHRQNWKLEGFFIAGSDWGGKQLVRCFNPLPSRADYFKGSLKSVLYEPSSGEFHLDIDHILIENCRRLPAKFFEDNCRPDDFTQIDGLSFSDAQKLDEEDERSINYFNLFQQKLKKDDKNYRFIKQLLDQSVEVAKKRAEWNYKTAIPMYYPTSKRLSFLLPLSLLEEGKVDVALVVEKMDNGNYQGQTILPLDWAYSNSRLVTKPESEWLETNNISISSEEDNF